MSNEEFSTYKYGFFCVAAEDNSIVELKEKMLSDCQVCMLRSNVLNIYA